MGVRERSIAAAVMVFLCFLLDKVGSVEMGTQTMGFGLGSPVVGLAIIMLLLANVRGTILSQRWKAAETPAEIIEMPERTTTSVADKLANVLPPKIWPKGRFVFYPLAGILLGLTLLGVIFLPFAAKKQPAQQQTIELQAPK